MTNASDPALTAALELRGHGHHVHLVSSADVRCVSEHCTSGGNGTPKER